MARNVEKNVKEAKTYLSKHRKRDLREEEIEQLRDIFFKDIKQKGFLKGLFNLVCNAWLFGFECGRKSRKSEKGA